MKGFFKSKFSKEKASKFFDKEGFYIVLFLCVCIVAITAVWVSRTQVNDKQNQNLGGANDNKTTINAPSKETSVPKSQDGEDSKIVVTEESKAAKEEDDSKQDDKKQSSGTQTKTAAPAASVKFGSPFEKGLATNNIAKDYSPTELVCFESLDEWRTHLGLDVKASIGTGVLGIYDGKVVDIRNDSDLQGGLGWTVVIDHGNGYQSVYANLDEKIEVKKNQSVKKGQIIGTVGRSAIFERDISEEAQEISHLHFEILKKGAKSYENVDPKEYLTMQE